MRDGRLPLADVDWHVHRHEGREVSGKVLGLVGVGRIGTEVARMAHGLSMTGASLSECYEEELRVERIDHRYRTWLASERIAYPGL